MIGYQLDVCMQVQWLVNLQVLLACGVAYYHSTLTGEPNSNPVCIVSTCIHTGMIANVTS